MSSSTSKRSTAKLVKNCKQQMKKYHIYQWSKQSWNKHLMSLRITLIVKEQRRKIEGDLKITQEVVGEMERAKKELDQAVLRKEREIGDLNSKLGEEQNAVSKLTRVIKETQGRVEEMEEELEAERQSRAKAERQRSELAREMEELTERIEEASGATAAQMELNKKRESEVIRMRKDLEEINIQQESTVLSLKKKTPRCYHGNV